MHAAENQKRSRRLPSIQLGVRRAGGLETAAQLIRAALHQSSMTHPGLSVALKIDFRNAFN